MAAAHPIGYWLKLVDRLIDERFDETLEEHGVTRRQWQLLGELTRSEATLEQLNTALTPFLKADADESLATQLDELVESGWVSASGDVYATTEHGKTAFTRLSTVVQGIRDALTDGLDEQEYATTLGVLERMARNLGWDGR
jgi:DNA-binding MarR family transcriptional regulator